MSKGETKEKPMERTVMIIMLICGIGLCGCISNQNQSGTNIGSGSQQQEQNIQGPITDVNVNLNFRDWYPWGGLQAIPSGNTVTLNGMIDTAGYVSEQVSQSLRGKTITLEIPNATVSSFARERLMKITVNKEDRLIQPNNVPDLIEREYIPSDYKLVEFVLPDDFDGKLGFVFYQADLNGLQIIATYR
jgi:hypothetical protein